MNQRSRIWHMELLMKPKQFPSFLTAVSVVTALLVGTWLSTKPRVIADEAAGKSVTSDSKSVEAPDVNVMDFGAHPDNEDNTRQIQQAIDTGKKAVVPPGSFSISGTLVIDNNEYLHLAHGAWLRRLADRTDNAEPVVRLTGNFSRLTGEGHACGVSSANASGQ